MKRILNTILAGAIALTAVTAIPVASIGTAAAQVAGGGRGGGGGGGGGGGNGGGDGDNLVAFFRTDKPKTQPLNEFPDDTPPPRKPKPRPRIVLVKERHACQGQFTPAFDTFGHQIGFYCTLRS